MLVSELDYTLSDSYVKIKPPQECFLTQKQAFKISDPAPSTGDFPEKLILIDAQDGIFHYAKIECYFGDKHQFIYDYHTQQTVTIPISHTRVLKLVPQILYQPRLPILLLASCFKSLSASQQNVFFPFLSGRIITPDIVITVIGDLHGHEKALRTIIEKLYEDGVIDKDGKIAPNHLIVFLGDFTDRGPYGLEIWYKVLELAIKNENQVFIQSGNHGAPTLTKNFHRDEDCSFYRQLKKMTNLDDADIEVLLQSMFTRLPQGMLFGIDPQDSSPGSKSPYHCIFLCHGGFEPFACVLKELMIQLVENHKKTAAVELDHLFEHPDPERSGYLWTDCRADNTPDERAKIEPSGRGPGLHCYNASAIRLKFNQLISEKPEHPCILDLLVRAHEHIECAIGKLNKVVKNGYNWASLVDDKTEFVDRGSVYTVISSTKYALPSTATQRIAYVDIGFSRDKNQFKITPHIFSKPRKITRTPTPQPGVQEIQILPS